MIIFGVAFFVIVVSLSQLLRNPPAGYIPFDAKADHKTSTTGRSQTARGYGLAPDDPHFKFLDVLDHVCVWCGCRFDGDRLGGQVWPRQRWDQRHLWQ